MKILNVLSIILTVEVLVSLVDSSSSCRNEINDLKIKHSKLSKRLDDLETISSSQQVQIHQYKNETDSLKQTVTFYYLHRKLN